jgi:hypothetical protein
MSTLLPVPSWHATRRLGRIQLQLREEHRAVRDSTVPGTNDSWSTCGKTVLLPQLPVERSGKPLSELHVVCP